MPVIKLERSRWSYDPAVLLGAPGGFGAVFAGTSPDGQPIAVKRLHVQANDAAHRELRIANELAGRNFQHVMPVLDAGQDADSDGYFVVMEECVVPYAGTEVLYGSLLTEIRRMCANSTVLDMKMELEALVSDCKR